MKMNKVLEQIEQNLGFQLPLEIVNIYHKAIVFPSTIFLFDTRIAGSNWLLKGDYFLLKPQEKNIKERGEYFIRDFYVKEGEGILETVNKKVSESVNQYWSEEKIFVFAWSNDLVEQDSSLIYVFENNGLVKGIYIHSFNYVNEKVFVASRLSDIYDLSQIESNSSVKYNFPHKLTKSIISYKELLKVSYLLLDSESVDDVKDYEFILKSFANLSENKFLRIINSLNEHNAHRSIEIEINNKRYFTLLEGNTDNIDLKIIDFVNDCLIDIGFTRKKFIAFSTPSFGQEVGIPHSAASLAKRNLWYSLIVCIEIM